MASARHQLRMTVLAAERARLWSRRDALRALTRHYTRESAARWLEAHWERIYWGDAHTLKQLRDAARGELLRLTICDADVSEDPAALARAERAQNPEPSPAPTSLPEPVALVPLHTPGPTALPRPWEWDDGDPKPRLLCASLTAAPHGPTDSGVMPAAA